MRAELAVWMVGVKSSSKKAEGAAKDRVIRPKNKRKNAIDFICDISVVVKIPVEL
jgi:hypothetical protein